MASPENLKQSVKQTPKGQESQETLITRRAGYMFQAFLSIVLKFVPSREFEKISLQSCILNMSGTCSMIFRNWWLLRVSEGSVICGVKFKVFQTFFSFYFSMIEKKGRKVMLFLSASYYLGLRLMNQVSLLLSKVCFSIIKYSSNSLPFSLNQQMKRQMQAIPPLQDCSFFSSSLFFELSLLPFWPRLFRIISIPNFLPAIVQEGSTIGPQLDISSTYIIELNLSSLQLPMESRLAQSQRLGANMRQLGQRVRQPLIPPILPAMYVTQTNQKSTFVFLLAQEAQRTGLFHWALRQRLLIAFLNASFRELYPSAYKYLIAQVGIQLSDLRLAQTKPKAQSEEALVRPRLIELVVSVLLGDKVCEHGMFLMYLLLLERRFVGQEVELAEGVKLYDSDPLDRGDLGLLPLED